MPLTANIKQLKRFLQLIENQLGLVFAKTKYGRLQKHLTTRITELECETVDDYLAMLIDKRHQTEEIAWWINVLTVGETYFYRNQPQWEALKQHVIPELMKRHHTDRTMRFWSAGCATGEEPYTLAILLNQVIPDLSSWHIEILATDVNPAFLTTAKIAKYSKHAVRNLSSEMLRKYFDKQHDHHILRPKIKKMVSFMTHNLVSDRRQGFRWQHEYFDVILCRNTIIYFTRERAEQVIAAITQKLSNDGYLFLGHSESLFSMDVDLVIEHLGNAFFYRKSSEKDFQKPDHSTAILAASMPKPAFPSLTPSKPITYERDSTYKSKMDSTSEVESIFTPKVESISTPKVESISTLGEEEILMKGKKLLQENEFEEAEQFLTAATEEHPLSGSIHLLRGITAKTQGKTDVAISAFKRVLYLDANNLLSRFYLASLWQAQGSFDRAMAQYRILLEQTEGQDPGSVVGSTEDLTIGLLRTACENALRQ